jgi:hypothetical protein
MNKYNYKYDHIIKINDQILKEDFYEIVRKHKVNRKRDLNLEERILKSQNPLLSVFYAREVIRDRWTEGEDIIFNFPSDQSIYFYLTYLVENKVKDLEDLFPKLEKCMVEFKDFMAIRYYISSVIKRRWKEGEDAIIESKSLNDINWYSKYYIKGRWKEGEQVFLEEITNINFSSHLHFHLVYQLSYYIDKIAKCKIDDIDKEVIKNMKYFCEKYPHVNIFRYINGAHPKGWEEAEEFIVLDANLSVMYAMKIIKRPFVKAHQNIFSSKTDKKIINRYTNFLNKLSKKKTVNFSEFLI